MKKEETTNQKKLKLFVWDGAETLRNYTSGLICVLAHDLEEALKLIKKECDYCQTSFDASNYKIITEPKAFLCWGGD